MSIKQYLRQTETPCIIEEVDFVSFLYEHGSFSTSPPNLYHELMSAEQPTKRCNGQGSRLVQQRSWVRIPGKAWISICPSLTPPMAERICSQNWQTRDSIPGRACRPSRSEFYVVFSETRVNIARIAQKDPTEDTPPMGQGPL